MTIENETTITIQTNTPAGRIAPLHGVNLGPRARTGAYNTAKYFTEIGFPLVRLHDCPIFCREIADIPCVFPLEHLDENDPQNYKFRRTDDYIRSIRNTGCGVLYRLGVSIENAPDFRYDTTPPKDWEKWARISANIIRHYNHGWADGFEWGIRYWEIWNEPDNGPSQWDGTMEEFIDFYCRVSVRLKQEFPDLMIGGPGFNGGMKFYAREKLDAFLPVVREKGGVLDFLSWHAYAGNPRELADAGRTVRETLDRYGYTQTESHLNEWNMGPENDNWGRQKDPTYRPTLSRQVGGPKDASFVAASLTAMQDAAIDMTNYYHGAYTLYGLFEEGGLPRKQYYAFRAYVKMLQETPQRCTVTGSNPENGLAVLAGRAEDGSTMQLLLSNFNSNEWQWSLHLQGPPGNVTRLSCRTIDEHINLLDTDDDGIALVGDNLSVNVPRHTVRLVKIELDTSMHL